MMSAGSWPSDHGQPLAGRHRERRPVVDVHERRRRAAGLEPERRLHVGRHAAHGPRLGPARQPLELARRQAEHLAQLADRPARAEGREGGHQRRPLAPVALVHARDQHRPDVTREVEIDVRQRGQLLVEEPPEEQLVGHRVDVREAGEVADDRGHRGPAPAARRQQRPHRRRPAHLHRHLARQLQQVAVQQEEAGQAQRVDHPQLLLEPRVRGGHVLVAGRVALPQLRPAQLGELAERLLVVGPRVAVPEVGAQVEPQAGGQLARLRHRLRVLGEARGHRLRRGQHVREVAAPHRLRGIQSRVMAQRRERVLQQRALARVRVDVAGGHRGHAQPRSQIGQRPVARPVVAQERPLQLDSQPVSTEHPQQPPQRRLVVHPAQSAAAQAHQPLGVLLDRRQGQLGRHVDPPHARADQRLPAADARPAGRTVLDLLVDRPTRVRVRAGEQVAQVAPAPLALHQQRQVTAVLEIHLRAVDGPQAERRRRLHELHRARDAVVVGQRHRLVAELGRGGGQLVGLRGAV